MVKGWQKRVLSYDKPTKIAILAIIEDVQKGLHDGYDIKPLLGHIGWYRLRKGKIRVIFSRQNTTYRIESIDTRGDVYKNI